MYTLSCMSRKPVMTETKNKILTMWEDGVRNKRLIAREANCTRVYVYTVLKNYNYI